MPGIGRRLPRAPVWGIVLLCLTGCWSAHQRTVPPPPVPHELAKVSLPPYVVEAPDVLLIDAIRLVPKPPYKIEPMDTIGIRVTDTLPDQPIQGVYGVEPDGKVNLGFNYGSVFVQGMTLEQAQAAIEKALRTSLKPPYQVSVVAADSRALQQIRGPHLVQPDGTVSLGIYGSVFVDNRTLPQAKAAIEMHLSQFFVNPEVSVSVSGFNSKVYYIVMDGGGATGDQILRLPMTGKTTVLDALASVGGLPFQASELHMWVSRPAPDGTCQEMVLPIDYNSIVKCGKVSTNYQLLPGDRLYVKADKFIATEAYLARMMAPFERIVGLNLLTNGLIGSYQGILQGLGFGQGGLFFGGVGGVGTGALTPLGF